MKTLSIIVLILGFFTLIIRQFSVTGTTVLFTLFGVFPITQEALIKGLNRIKAFFPILGTLVLGAISSTEEKSIAMDARAFFVKCKHTFLRELKPVPVYEKIVLIVTDICFVLLVVFKIYQIFG